MASDSDLPYRQSLDPCFDMAVGEGGLDHDLFRRWLARTGDGLAELRAAAASRTWPLLTLPFDDSDLADLAAVTRHLANTCSDVVIAGMGGSSLGGRLLAGLADPPSLSEPAAAVSGRPRLHTLDNIDPWTADALVARLDPATTGWILVSKSGGTAETLIHALAVRRAGPGRAGPVVVVTSPGDSPLARFADATGAIRLAHDPHLAGRYSLLSVSGLLPAMLAGVDGRAVRDGARAVLAEVTSARAPEQVAPALGAALNVAMAEERGVSQTIILPYVDRLAPFALWYRQLWAESTGKSGKGTTPVDALGAVDQHSQLQFWLHGPADKLFTVITADVAGLGPAADPTLARAVVAPWLAGRTVGDLMAAEQEATVQTLTGHGRPVRRLTIARPDGRTVGALAMHFMLETVLACRLWQVDPFSQPAVDEGKALARRILAGEDGDDESGSGGGV